jgi:hypothetical protein
VIAQIKGLVGDLARPYAVIAVATATAQAIIVGRSAEVIGAAGFVLAALYGAKTVENAFASKHDASVAIAQAKA